MKFVLKSKSDWGQLCGSDDTVIKADHHTSGSLLPLLPIEPRFLGNARSMGTKYSTVLEKVKCPIDKYTIDGRSENAKRESLCICASEIVGL